MTETETARATLERVQSARLATPAARALAARVAETERAAMAAHAPHAPRSAAPRIVPEPYRPRILARAALALAPRSLRA